jgi:ADP-heptose:LPS heptosyltransferase
MRRPTIRLYNNEDTRLMRKNIHKVLIIRFSSIGDIVLTTPIVRCMKRQMPGIEIHYLCKKQYHEIVSSNPYISKFWLFDDNFQELIPELRSENFDFIIDLHKNLRSCYVRFRLNKPTSSFPKLNFQKWLMVNLKINLLPPVHLVDRYFKALKPLGIVNDGQGLDYFIPGNEEIDLSTLPVDFRRAYIAFVTGGKHSTKILPEEKVTILCKNLEHPVILLGGKEDRERGDNIVSRTDGKIFNACGIYSINQSASIIRQADKVITNDTGLMHIAAAFKKPVLSIWGNTIPGFGMYPYLPVEYRERSSIFEVKNLSCRPCSKIGFSECPKKHFKCMLDQDLDAIIKAGKERVSQ